MQSDAGLAGLGDGPGEAAFFEALGTDPKPASVKENEEVMTTEQIFGEGVSDETKEAVETFAHVDGVGGGEGAGSGGEAEHNQASRRRRKPSSRSACGGGRSR